jgi:sulfhydrogenase subunit beta (sulfur reductase)
MQRIEISDFNRVLEVLTGRGYSLIGPRIRDGAITLDSISSTADLPVGWSDSQEPASYRLQRSNDDAFFSYVLGPMSWKKFMFPPRAKIFTAKKTGKGFEVVAGLSNEHATRKYAFVGIRSCELHAIALQDKVFATGEQKDPTYASLRDRIFTVAVNCVHPGGNCFCSSMNTGPRATEGFDLAITEVLGHDHHYFLLDAGSAAGESLMQEIPHHSAEQGELEEGERLLARAAMEMGKELDTQNIGKLLNDNFENPHWDDVAKRCMACANCTMVCPTCFCSTVEDLTDLSGASAERWRRWDSCFTNDFTKIAGGNIRMSTRTRYRQWMTHKLGNWIDQFGESGCVGCGRCITWCPVGIDITAEARTIRETSLTSTTA